jgi:hypothetical protein
MSVFSGELALGDPECKDIPYPQLKAPVQVDWQIDREEFVGDKWQTYTYTHKGWYLHECHGCGHQWICPHAECGDKTHGCTRSSVEDGSTTKSQVVA